MVWYRDRVVVVSVIRRGTHLLNPWRVNHGHGHHKVVRKTVLHLTVFLANRTKVEATMHQTWVTWRVLFDQQNTIIFKILAAVSLIHVLNIRGFRCYETLITSRWYFLCRVCLTFPVYIPHIHQTNNKPSHIRKDVCGSMPGTQAIIDAAVRPPSTTMEWQIHALVHDVSSSLRVS